MPPLPNTRHERFAQELAKGKTATEAYVLAGYKPDDGNASKLANKVIARVQDITGRAAQRVEITLAKITTDLERIAAKAEGLGEAPGLSVARNAKMDVAKLHGLITDKHEHTGADGGPIETMDVTARELIERRVSGLAARGATEGNSGRTH